MIKRRIERLRRWLCYIWLYEIRIMLLEEGMDIERRFWFEPWLMKRNKGD